MGKQHITIALLVVFSLLVISASSVDDRKPATDAEWNSFIRHIETVYLTPNNMQITQFDFQSMATLMGFAIGQQTGNVGGDEGKKALMNRLMDRALNLLDEHARLRADMRYGDGTREAEENFRKISRSLNALFTSAMLMRANDMRINNVIHVPNDIPSFFDSLVEETAGTGTAPPTLQQMIGKATMYFVDVGWPKEYELSGNMGEHGYLVSNYQGPYSQIGFKFWDMDGPDTIVFINENGKVGCRLKYKGVDEYNPVWRFEGPGYDEDGNEGTWSEGEPFLLGLAKSMDEETAAALENNRSGGSSESGNASGGNQQFPAEASDEKAIRTAVNELRTGVLSQNTELLRKRLTDQLFWKLINRLNALMGDPDSDQNRKFRNLYDKWSNNVDINILNVTFDSSGDGAVAQAGIGLGGYLNANDNKLHLRRIDGIWKLESYEISPLLKMAF